MKKIVPLAAALLIAAPAAGQSSHSAHHPARKAVTPIAKAETCPDKMQGMSGNMDQMMQMHQQMMGQMQQMMQMMGQVQQMMQAMQQHQQGMGMTMPKTTPPTDTKPH